jgi:prepilin-type N-terminal cleavage/methylation domain-containing protein
VKKGITLVELLVVVGIVAVLGAIAYSISGPARLAAKKSANLGVARNLWIAHSLYRTEYEGDSVFGKASAMGLPYLGDTYEEIPQLRLTAFGAVWRRDWISSCNRDHWFLPRYSENPMWEREALDFKEQTILLMDVSCGQSKEVKSQFDIYSALGVEISGRMFYRSGRGDPIQANSGWWNLPPQ